MKVFCSRCRRTVEQRDFRQHMAGHSSPASQMARAARRKRLGYDRPEIARTMRRVIKRDGECMQCGATEGLTAHFLPAGPHLPISELYLTLCRHCHGKIDGPRAHKG